MEALHQSVNKGGSAELQSNLSDRQVQDDLPAEDAGVPQQVQPEDLPFEGGQLDGSGLDLPEQVPELRDAPAQASTILTDVQMEQLKESLAFSANHSIFWVLVLLALFLSLGALSFSLMNWAKSRRMSALNIENLSSKEFARFPDDVIERILKDEKPPHNLSLEDQQSLWALLRRTLREHIKTQHRAEKTVATDKASTEKNLLKSVQPAADLQSISRDIESDGFDDQYRSIQSTREIEDDRDAAPVAITRTTSHMSEDRRIPQERLPTGLEVQKTMLPLGKEGMRSRGVKYDWLTFCRNNNVDIFDLSDEGVLVRRKGKVPTSQQWFFALVDDATQYSALFFGPALIENSDLIQSDAVAYSRKFSSFFHVEIKGAKPELLTPPIIDVTNNKIIEKGRMTI